MSLRKQPDEATVEELLAVVADEPYSPLIRLRLATKYAQLEYPDLASGEAYMALLLCDEIYDEDSEFHDQAFEAVKNDMSPDIETNVLDVSKLSLAEDESNHISDWVKVEIEHWVYVLLSQSLLLCANLRSAHDFCSTGLRKFPNDKELSSMLSHIESVSKSLLEDQDAKIEDYTDKGRVRREIYPWNDHELPDRCAQSNVDNLNKMLQEAGSKLEVCAVELPSLRPNDHSRETIKQLGLFAKEDLLPGDIILTEISLLTATSKLNDPFCDACSARLLKTATTTISCRDCYEVVFCSAECHDRAMAEYHPAACEAGVDSIAKDAPLPEVATALYTLLLFRSFAMAITQSTHPLDLPFIKHIWGDFNPPTTPPKLTLPFSFRYNILLPLNYLEKALDQSPLSPAPNIFTCPWANVATFNTLLAKFRGTASARQALDGTPEVGAVHPLWCLANHSCDPNVKWEWEGAMRFWIREERMAWEGKDKPMGKAGIGKGEEILSHYCDVELGVKDRREWAEGALGGMCTCARCLWELNLEMK